jgi:hypothetical protein
MAGAPTLTPRASASSITVLHAGRASTPSYSGDPNECDTWSSWSSRNVSDLGYKRRSATDLEISRYLALLIQRKDRVTRALLVDPQVSLMSHSFGKPR